MSPAHRAALTVYLTGTPKHREMLLESLLSSTSPDGKVVRSLRHAIPPPTTRARPPREDS